MTRNPLNLNQVKDSFKVVKDHPLSKIWRGYGATLFLEFGAINSENKGQYTLASETGWYITVHGEKHSYTDNDWNKLDTLVSLVNEQHLLDCIITNDSIELHYDTLQFRLHLEGMNNNKWSLSPILDGHLTCYDGRFVIEKEG